MADLTDEELAEVLDGGWPSDPEEAGSMIHEMATELHRLRRTRLNDRLRVALTVAIDWWASHVKAASPRETAADECERDKLAECRAMLAQFICRRCSECVGEEHHWMENDAVYQESDPWFVCKHCGACCHEIDDEATGLPIPSGVVINLDVTRG